MKAFWTFALNLALAAALDAAPLPAEWQHDQTIQIERAGLVKISLPLETLDAARPALEDLRLYDDQGREVPFRLDRPVRLPKVIRPAHGFQVNLGNEKTVATFQTGLTQAIEAVTLETPARGFIKSVTLEGSADGSAWAAIAQGMPVFRQADEASRLQLSFAAGTWAWLRVSLDDRRGTPIPLTGAQVHAASAEAMPAEPLDLKITDRDEVPGQTRLTLQAAGAHVTLAELAIETAEPLFTRQVTLAFCDYVENEARETFLARGTIYRVAVEGQPAVASLGFADEVVLPARELILTIRNGDSPPLPVTAVRAMQRPVYLTWLAPQPGAFHLLSGNARCAAPHYDLAVLPATLAVPPAAPHGLAPLAANPAFRAPEAVPELQPIGTAIDLAKWKFRKHLALARPGVQQLELDLETLSRVGSACADLRVVRKGLQLPYLLERPRFTRTFAPSVTPTNDPKRATVSRWLIRLPYARLPVTALTCETEAPFFQRAATLTAQVFDERGNPHTLQLASTTWVRTLDAPKKGVLRLELASPPRTDLLLLEVENGDNPPLALTTFQLTYPATRVLFKAAADTDTYLYYGNPEVGPPSYDIGLVARQLLAAQKAKATLGPAEPLKKDSWAEREGFRGAAGWIFWVVLGIVVVGLLVVIARLLPKAPA